MGNERIGAMEKLASSVTTMMAARLAMIATPLLIGFFAWLVLRVLDNIDSRLVAAEASIAMQAKTLQDHESRMTYGRQDRLAFQQATKDQFSAVGINLQQVSTSLNGLTLSVGELRTVIDERVPKTAHVQP